MSKVVSATFILAEESDFPGMNEEVEHLVSSKSSCATGAKLPIRPKGMKV